MRNLFALIGFAVVVFAGLGWYLGWYKLDWTTSSDGTTSIQIDVNRSKLSGDIKSGANKAGELIETFKNNSTEEKARNEREDPTFVGPPIPVDWRAPSEPVIQPGASLPAPRR